MLWTTSIKLEFLLWRLRDRSVTLISNSRLVCGAAPHPVGEQATPRLDPPIQSSVTAQPLLSNCKLFMSGRTRYQDTPAATPAIHSPCIVRGGGREAREDWPVRAAQQVRREIRDLWVRDACGRARPHGVLDTLTLLRSLDARKSIHHRQLYA
jgi:hypothetical protein